MYTVFSSSSFDRRTRHAEVHMRCSLNMRDLARGGREGVLGVSIELGKRSILKLTGEWDRVGSNGYAVCSRGGKYVAGSGTTTKC